MSPAFARFTALALCLRLIGSSAAQSVSPRDVEAFPTRPIRFVVPFAPGGSNDALARMFAQKLSERFGQQVIVDNRAGAGSIVGTEIVARARPDGYTMLMVGQGFFLNPSLYKKLPYGTLKDFAAISLVVSTPSMLAAHPSVNANTLKDLIALAKANPGKLNYASAGVGSNGHLSMELLQQMAGVKLVHIPYKGGGEALTATLSNHVQLVFTAPSSVIQHAKAGRLRAFGVSSAKRLPSIPDVPAIAETLPGYEVVNEHGVLAPAGTPKPIIEKLNRAFVDALQMRDLRERMAALGFEPVGSTPEELTKKTTTNVAKYAKLLKSAGINPE